MRGRPGDGSGAVAERDWNAILERVLRPFRSEEAAFRVLVAVAIIFGSIIAIVLLARAIF